MPRAAVVEKTIPLSYSKVFAHSVATPNSLQLDHDTGVVMLEDAPGGGCKVTGGSHWISRVTTPEALRPGPEQLCPPPLDAIAKG